MPLRSEVISLIDLNHPFWSHAKKELFVVVDENNRVCGRIAAIIDDSHNKIHNEKTVFLFF